MWICIKWLGSFFIVCNIHIINIFIWYEYHYTCQYYYGNLMPNKYLNMKKAQETDQKIRNRLDLGVTICQHLSILYKKDIQIKMLSNIYFVESNICSVV